jgi:hypothetical protein
MPFAGLLVLKGVVTIMPKIPAGLTGPSVTVADLITMLQKMPPGTNVYHYTEMCGGHGYSHPGLELHGDDCIINYRWSDSNDTRVFDSRNGDNDNA